MAATPLAEESTESQFRHAALAGSEPRCTMTPSPDIPRPAMGQADNSDAFNNSIGKFRTLKDRWWLPADFPFELCHYTCGCAGR